MRNLPEHLSDIINEIINLWYNDEINPRDTLGGMTFTLPSKILYLNYKKLGTGESGFKIFKVNNVRFSEQKLLPNYINKSIIDFVDNNILKQYNLTYDDLKEFDLKLESILSNSSPLLNEKLKIKDFVIYLINQITKKNGYKIKAATLLKHYKI